MDGRIRMHWQTLDVLAVSPNLASAETVPQRAGDGTKTGSGLPCLVTWFG